MPGNRESLCAKWRVCLSDHGLGAIPEAKHRHTTKCFEESDEMQVALGYLGLMAVVGVWVIAYGLAELL